jgi:hypothetical protein
VTQLDSAFVVEFDIATPVIMDRGIGLPGLLAWVIASQGTSDPLAHVPLRIIDGIFAGSDLFALGDAIDFHVPYVRSLRPMAMPHDLALSDRRGRPMDQITLRDERKNLLDFRKAASTPTLVAFGQGKLDVVRSLVSGLQNIGAKRSSGYGAISSVRVAAISHPHAGFADRDGNPTRPVPVATWEQMNLPPRPTRNLVARLPRWEAPREPCVGPREWVIEVDDYERELAE